MHFGIFLHAFHSVDTQRAVAAPCACGLFEQHAVLGSEEQAVDAAAVFYVLGVFAGQDHCVGELLVAAHLGSESHGFFLAVVQTRAALGEYGLAGGECHGPVVQALVESAGYFDIYIEVALLYIGGSGHSHVARIKTLHEHVVKCQYVAVVVQVGKADVHGLACICVKVDRVCRKLKVAETRIFTRGDSAHTFTASEGSGCQSAVTGFSVTNTCRSLRAWLLSWRIWRLWASNVSMKSSVGISRGFDTSQSLLLAGFWYAECEAI